jgi:hypothetical protein
MNKWIAAIVIGVLCGFGAVKAHAWYEGQIVDAETKQPISGAVVFMEWSKPHFPEGHSYVDAFETLTDEGGRFSLPRYWSWNLWTLAWSRHLITIFKSGYEPIESGGYGWGAFTRQQGGDPTSPDVWKIEHGKPIILLKRASSDLKERRLKWEQVYPGGPDEKKVRILNELKKEREIVVPQN